MIIGISKIALTAIIIKVPSKTEFSKRDPLSLLQVCGLAMMNRRPAMMNQIAWLIRPSVALTGKKSEDTAHRLPPHSKDGIR